MGSSPWDAVTFWGILAVALVFFDLSGWGYLWALAMVVMALWSTERAVRDWLAWRGRK
jgi:hypothetical protein